MPGSDHRDLLAHKVRKDLLAHKVRKVRLAQLVRMPPGAELVLKVHKVHKDLPVLKVRSGIRDQTEIRAERQERKDLQVHKALLVLKDLPAQREPLALLVQMVVMGPQDLKVPLDQLDHREFREAQQRLAPKAQLVQRESTVQLALLAHKEFKVRLARRGQPAPQVRLDPMAPPVLRVQLAREFKA